MHVCYQETCSLCGAISEETDYAWHFVDCPDGGIEGTEIKLTNPGNELYFCDVLVYGIGEISFKYVF